jgi:cytochrome c oxidase assembly factor CtaG/ferredoxin
MDPTFDAFLASWPFDPWVLVPLLLTAAIYVRGWNALRRRSRRFGSTQLYCFLGGILALLVALASPVEPFASLLLQIHMLQHLLLMIVAPPLLWAGLPLLPLLRGLPGPVRRYWIAPLFRVPLLRALFARLTSLPVAWVLFVAMTWIWHAPAMYERALASDGWHALEHACFLGAGMLFWYPVVAPYPARPAFSRWLLLPYLLFADVQNTALAALFTFSGSVVYSHYAAAPRLWGVSAINDQAAAGLWMWVPGSLVMLAPLVVIARGLLYGKGRAAERKQAPHPRPLSPSAGRGEARIALNLVSAHSPPDLLRWPALGQFLRWRHARLALQLPLFALALLVIYDGISGPPAGPMNLAGVLPWVHWRGFVVLGLFAAGNVFCMACPFMLPRTLARRWLPAGRAWPRWLRSKWLAIGLLIVFFWAYEVFALWDSPWWTAWITIGYFIAAFAIDGIFRGASFCKYVCPIGQFHFVQSLVSPLEIRVRDPGRCLTCTTKECIRGSTAVPGCELNLYVPRKAGNMDCTLCLDCVHACPHDNIGLMPTIPGAELIRDVHRSGVGRFSRRADLAALVLVLVFAAFAGAAAMVAPVGEAAQAIATALGISSVPVVIGAGVVLAITLVPLVLTCLAAALSRRWSGDRGAAREAAARFVFTLVPLGFAMWLAHFSFHLFTTADAGVPVLQRFLADQGWTWFGMPAWRYACCAVAGTGLLRLEIVFLDIGLLASLYLGYRVALDRLGTPALAVRAFAPWAALMLLLFALGIWVPFQPMEMRGLLGG